MLDFLQALLMSTFRQATQLSRLALPLCNDLLLKAIAVYCRYVVPYLSEVLIVPVLSNQSVTTSYVHTYAT